MEIARKLFVKTDEGDKQDSEDDHDDLLESEPRNDKSLDDDLLDKKDEPQDHCKPFVSFEGSMKAPLPLTTPRLASSSMPAEEDDLSDFARVRSARMKAGE